MKEAQKKVCVTVSLVVILFLMGCASTNEEIYGCETLSQNQINNLTSEGKILNISFHNQETEHSCTQAAVQMVLEYFGVKHSQSRVKDISKNMTGREAVNYMNPILENELENRSLHIYVDNATLDGLSYYVHNIRWPIIVRQYVNGVQHVRVVIGIDRDYVFIADPHWNCNISRIRRKRFLEDWHMKIDEKGNKVNENGTFLIYEIVRDETRFFSL